MNKSTVALVRCSSYDREEVFRAVREGVELLGGARRFVSPGEQILLKPNVLAGTPPEECVCTHPAVFHAVGRLFRAVTPRLCYGDSPGSGASAAHLEKAELASAAADLDLPLAVFDTGSQLLFEASPQARRFVIADGVLEADGLVSISKLKTHQLTRMTGAVKNLYGCIPGAHKRLYHFAHPSAFDFSSFLVALNLLLRDRTRLHVMDGIMAMEGNGPQNGTPVHLGVLLFSTDPVALDAVMASLVELNPLRLPTASPGRRWGLGTYELGEIDLVGDRLAALRNGDFRVARGPVLDFSADGALTVINNLIARRPVIDARRCTCCGQCVESCPVNPKALSQDDQSRPPSYSYLRCTRCFCCQEICPEGAISVRRTVLNL
jgi:uncharacterized protein (DUF362 family)/Pyruvate/2-oxoacid:ferredoxin oxidoreductase delta subunit